MLINNLQISVIYNNNILFLSQENSVARWLISYCLEGNSEITCSGIFVDLFVFSARGVFTSSDMGENTQSLHWNSNPYPLCFSLEMTHLFISYHFFPMVTLISLTGNGATNIRENMKILVNIFCFDEWGEH